MRSTSPLLFLLSASCATARSAPSADLGSTAPPPFSAAQIRAATADGRTYTFRVTHEGQAIIRKMTFEDVTDEGARVDGQNFDLAGQPLGPPSQAPATWAELVGHAAYPAKHTVVEDVSVEVPAGRYECKLYVVSEPTGEGVRQTRAWFAKDLPGAPVRHEVRVGGAIVSSMELLSHNPGR